MRHLITILLVIVSVWSFSQEKIELPKADWNGYTQLRLNSNFDDNTSFMLRRMKLWLKSTPEFSENWSYKLQGIITSLSQEKFFFQDAKLTYSRTLFSFNFGQFVPAYSLQWSQPDYLIPTIERATVINNITPNGSFGARALGAQANFTSKNKLISSSLGLFNGYGIKEYRFGNKGYMLTHKTTLSLNKNKNLFQIGYSLLYRNAENLQLKNILPDIVLFSGNDFRYNIFVLFQSNFFKFQAEYLNANLESRISNGYYLLASIKFKQKSQIVVSYEKYSDLIESTNDAPWLHLGYNFFVNKNKLMIHFDNYFQFNSGNIQNYTASVQLNIFFK